MFGVLTAETLLSPRLLGACMKRLILLVGLLFIIASCDVAPPLTYCGDGIVQSPNDDGIFEVCDWGVRNADTCDPEPGGVCETCTTACDLVTFSHEAPAPLTITAPERYEVQEGQGGIFPIEVSRDASVHAWVEETSYFYGTYGLASGLGPQTVYPAGPVELDISLEVDYPLTEYVLDFEEALDREGLFIQFEVYDAWFRLFEKGGSLIIMSEDDPVFIAGRGESRLVGLPSATDELTLIDVEETIIRDDGPMNAFLEITLPDGSTIMRSVAADREYALGFGVRLAVEEVAATYALITLHAEGYEQSFDLPLHETVEAEVLGMSFSFELLEIQPDRDAERTAYVTLNDGPPITMREDSFVRVGPHLFFVDAIITSFGTHEDPAIDLMYTQLVRRLAPEGFEQLSFGTLEWAPMEFMELYLEGEDTLESIRIREDHTLVFGNENALDDAFLRFLITEQWGEYRLFDPGVSAGMNPDGRVTVSGARAGEYTIVIEARDGDETAQARVAFIVE